MARLRAWRLFSATLVASLSMAAGAIEVKGLTIGSVVSHQDLADIFGNAKCPAPEEIPQRLSTFGMFTCKAPISYLGVSTTAKIFITDGWRANKLEIQFPQDALADVESLFRQKYGEPSTKRGAPYEVNLIEVGSGKTSTRIMHEDCSVWLAVESSNIKVCDSLAGLDFKSGVSYEYARPARLDATDL